MDVMGKEKLESLEDKIPPVLCSPNPEDQVRRQVTIGN